MPDLSTHEVELNSISIDSNQIDALLEKEWLLTNQRGSYSSSSVLGCNTRRYHGLLIASMHPPIERWVTLSNVLEHLVIGGKTYELSSYEFSGSIHPQGYKHLKSFSRTDGVHFQFQIGSGQIDKSIYLSYEKDQLIINYDFSGFPQSIDFKLLPMAVMRDFHALRSSSDTMLIKNINNTAQIQSHPEGPKLHLWCPAASFDNKSDWWYGLHYRTDQRRGQDHLEDICNCGHFRVQVEGDQRITLIAEVTPANEQVDTSPINTDKFIDRLKQRRHELIRLANAQDEDEEALALAADPFIVQRNIEVDGKTKESSTILAGYHWFADWGRDTFIALPGLLLKTGRHEEAKQVLLTFASVVNLGQIPNRFDDYGGAPHYNSIDASLWFINAAYLYLKETNDEETFHKHLRPKIEEIVNGYRTGTRDHIHADSDGLISGGDADTQLTWMDAKCNGEAFTPRYGKAVEINALWYNAICILEETSKEKSEKETYRQQITQIKESFTRLFWNNDGNYLNDCIYPDGGVDKGVRPNQIFAVSLPFSCLSKYQQQGVVAIAQKELLNGHGLRSLSPKDSRYRNYYFGDQYNRDSAYHQGTTWGFLMGPFIEAFLKANDYTNKAKDEAEKIIEPLLRHLNETACIGNVSEIFDGDYPHTPKGCIAQAWSVAGLIVSKKLIGI